MNNRYSNSPIDNVQVNIEPEHKTPKRPATFVYGVTNYKKMRHKLRNIVENEQYITKILADNTIIVICNFATHKTTTGN